MTPNKTSTRNFAISVIGKDKPGIVAAIAEVLYKLGCNIADSSCTMLAGEFAMILIVSHPAPLSKTLLFEELKPPCDNLGLSLSVRMLANEESVREEHQGEICLVSVYGADKPGIVYRVAETLAKEKINIMDLTTKLIGTKEEPVYVMMLEVALADEENPENVSKLLENLKRELNVEIGVRTVTPVSL